MGVFRYANTYERGIEIVSSANANMPDLGKLITHRYRGLGEALQAFEMARRTVDNEGRLVLKVVIEMGHDDERARI